MKQPVVFYVEGPYTQTADELAEKTYDDEDSLLLYTYVIDEVSPRTAKKLGERAYEEDMHIWNSWMQDYRSKSTVTGTLYSALAASRAVHAAGSASVGSG